MQIDLTLERVETKEVLKKEWGPLLKEIFSDEDDRVPLGELLRALDDKATNIFYIFRDESEDNNRGKGKAFGIGLRQVCRDISDFAYAPWSGLQ